MIDDLGRIVAPGSNPRRSCGPLAAILPVFSRRFQFPIPVDLNLLLASGQHILRRDLADGTVQADVVVMLDVALYQTQCIVQRKRCSRPDALAL
jgi:hypothetical protein